ncbi:glycosyltransferase [Mycolicibacterium gilvum]|uniref:Glycosyl transferase family protein n=1 Tax=Mycolicibacterium gilvum TaxID=1804 RepID=A0A378SE55_9MYCO|nr:glycosyltransferase [Mycolicibacterium gilvum]MCV7055984.1 glycosyltransferase family 1 protein [Mycolicibacterium gilvum]STZ41000.1 glycosyl transferase family protein [Mycolicibacterium gilvum]
MAVILAYTAPALGHLFPFCAVLQELARRGHDIHVRTLAAGLQICRDEGFTAAAVDPRIEAIQADDTLTGTVRAAADTVEVLTARAPLEVADLLSAVESVQPDVVIVDANCWGAMSVAETLGRPWVVLSPFTPYLRSPGAPPFGPGATPWPGPLGRIRDWGIGLVTTAVFDRPFARQIAPLRRALGLTPVRTAGDLLLRAPAVLVATGKPLEYPHTDWGETVTMIGPAVFEPRVAQRLSWLDQIDDPIVLVTTSSVGQSDAALVETAVEALRDEPVHLVVTAPTGDVDVMTRPGVTQVRFAPHSMLLEHAVCVITHGGMGVTQKALARGVPVCVVPFGRDQFEVARRVELAGCGTRLPAGKLSVGRLRTAVKTAATMTGGAARVAAGFAATGGVARGADVVESRLVARCALPEEQ